MHSRPELSRELPVRHKHTKEPWLFRQSPLMQGLDWHSSTSGDTETRTQGAGGCETEACQGRSGHPPSQTSVLGLKE